MSTALIGHTGFVGGNLAAQAQFDDCYNSRTIEGMTGKSYDLVVCSGARAEKWLANKQPDADREGIARLTKVLATVRARKMVLISTVDVFQQPVNVDETTLVTLAGLSAYGRHRFELEEFVRSRFPTLIVRLPGLFGPGLKKNAIYDLLYDNRVDLIHPAAIYQFYDVTRLWNEITVAQNADLPLVHFATEPVSMAEVAREGFGREFSHAAAFPPARYDFHTRYAGLYGGPDNYLYSRQEVVQQIRDFASSQRQRAA